MPDVVFSPKAVMQALVRHRGLGVFNSSFADSGGSTTHGGQLAEVAGRFPTCETSGEVTFMLSGEAEGCVVISFAGLALIGSQC